MDQIQRRNNRFITGRTYDPTATNQRNSGEVIFNNCRRVGSRGFLRDPRISQQ